jgi:choloylglycine hydrolase
MTFYGDYSRESLSAAGTNDRQDVFIGAGSASYHCSLFSVFGLPGQYRLGRSFDNPAGWKCLTLLTRVHPNDGYASLAPMRLRDIGFSPGSDFDALAFAAKRRLLDAVRFPPDGVNESGLVMGLANVTPQPYVPNPSKETIHFCLWVRKVLDECRTVDEAVALTRQYNILSSGSTLDVHAMVADASGHSIILEPAEGEMKVIRGQGPFQVMTNSPVYGIPLGTQLAQCPRFRLIHETLEAAGGALGSQGCWDILRQVGNVWTEWSAVYGISAGSAALAIDFDFEPLYDFYPFPLGGIGGRSQK